jgi:hypothetical protein
MTGSSNLSCRTGRCGTHPCVRPFVHADWWDDDHADFRQTLRQHRDTATSILLPACHSLRALRRRPLQSLMQKTRKLDHRLHETTRLKSRRSASLPWHRNEIEFTLVLRQCSLRSRFQTLASQTYFIDLIALTNENSSFLSLFSSSDFLLSRCWKHRGGNRWPG